MLSLPLSVRIFVVVMVCFEVLIAYEFWSLLRPEVDHKVKGIRVRKIYDIIWIGYVWFYLGMRDIIGNGVEWTVVFLIIMIKLVRMQAQIDREGIRSKMVGENYQEIYQMYTEMQCIRHDMKNHVLSIESMLEAGEYEKAHGYLKEISEDVKASEGVIVSGNGMVDAILSTKTRLAESENIVVDISCDFMGEMKISEKDMCTILANLYDNSIEACKKVPDDRWTEIKIVKNKGMMLLKFRNKFSGKLRKVGKRFLSVKKDKKQHGFGLESVRKTVEKYDGNMDVSIESHVFTVCVTFYDAFEE